MKKLTHTESADLRDSSRAVLLDFSSAVLRDASSAELRDFSSAVLRAVLLGAGTSAKIVAGSLAVVIDRHLLGKVRVYTAQDPGPCEVIDGAQADEAVGRGR